MSVIIAYLTFNGNCREAMTFYQECLGGQLFFQSIGDSVLSGQWPEKLRKFILHAVLKSENIVLTGTDMVGEKGLIKGNSVSLLLQCQSENAVVDCYQKLAVGGEPTSPPEETNWGDVLGGLTDKFGNNWLLKYERHSKVNKN